MIAISSLLIALALSMLVMRVAALALMLTGMSRESARFQARSSFTGVGFTTRESEDIVEHPVRRQIVMSLMLTGNAGVATVMATSMLSAVMTSQSDEWWKYLLILLVGLWILWFVASNRRIERHLNRLIAYFLRRWAKLEVKDFVAMLQLQNGYAVTELLVKPEDWLANQTLIALKLPQEGVLVLSVQRKKGPFLGTPAGDTEIHAGDIMVLYGPIERIEELDQRRRGEQGNVAHNRSTQEHTIERQEQEELDDQADENSGSPADHKR